MRAAEMRAATCWLGCSVASNGDARPASDQDARGGLQRGQGAPETAPHGFPVLSLYRVTLRRHDRAGGRTAKQAHRMLSMRSEQTHRALSPRLWTPNRVLSLR